MKSIITVEILKNLCGMMSTQMNVKIPIYIMLQQSAIGNVPVVPLKWKEKQLKDQDHFTLEQVIFNLEKSLKEAFFYIFD